MISLFILLFQSSSYATTITALPPPPTIDQIEEQALQEKVSAIFEEANKNAKYECKQPDDPIRFPNDSYLIGCVQQNKIFDRWPPSCRAAEKVTVLKCRDSRINSLDGIEQFPNLETLTIDKMQDNASEIQSLAPLRNLVNLRNLEMPYSRISDIVFLSRLPSLEYLNLDHNHVTDLTYIRLMKKLHSLSLKYQAPNYLTDLTMLSKINNIAYLDIEGNRVSDISPIISNTGLRQLNIRDNRITTLEPLRTLPYLYIINFSINIIRDISPLADIQSMAGIYGRLNRLSDISSLAKLNNLIEVDLRENFITDVSVFKGMRNILAILLDFNLVRNISAIEMIRTYSSVEELGFSYNCIPKSQIDKIWYLDQIAIKRFEKQCEIPWQDNNTFITTNVVNKDLVDLHNDKNFDEIFFNVNKVGGCSINGSDNYDMFMIMIFIVIVIHLTVRRVKRKSL